MTTRLPRLPRLNDLGFGVLAGVLTVLVIALVETGAVGRFFAASTTRTVTATFADARQLTKGDPVRISGVNVGDVESVTLNPGGKNATVRMALNSKPGPLYANASAQILFRTLLGGAFYVSIQRGTPGTGSLGSRTITDTNSQVEVDDVTSVVVGQAKQGLQRLPGDLSTALSDPNLPAQTLQNLASSSPTLAGGLGAARGERPATDIPTLLKQANTTLDALNAPYGALKNLVSGAASTVDATAAQSQNLEATLSGAPQLLSQASSTMISLRRTLSVANPLLVNLEPSAPQVAGTVADLRGTVIPANRLLANAKPLLTALRPGVANLASASERGLPLLRQLTPSLDELADKIVPYLNEVQPDTKHTFAEMVGPGAAALAAIGAYVDNDGGFVRFPATSGSDPLYLPCTTYVNDPTEKEILACDSISTAMSQLFSGTLGQLGSDASGIVGTVAGLKR